MSEQEQNDKKNLDSLRTSGKIHELTGTKPVEAIQKLINEDPEKQKAYIEGAIEGRRIKEEEENPTSK